MSATGSGYDQSTTTYSPDGRVFQVEYAQKAVEKSATVLGVKCKDGVVLAVEKPISSKMMVRTADGGMNRRIYTVDEQAGIAISGFVSDGRQLVNKARDESRDYRSFFGVPIPGQVLSDRLAGHIHNHTLYWYLRPFGCSILLASYTDRSGPELYCLDATGSSYRYLAAAIGKYKQGAKTELEKINFTTVTCREAVKEVAKIIYKLHDDIKDKEFELELSWVCQESKQKHVFVPKDLRDEAISLGMAEKKKVEMEDESDDDDDDDDDTSKTKKSSTTATTTTTTTASDKDKAAAKPTSSTSTT